jgi:hypothetical protein
MSGTSLLQTLLTGISAILGILLAMHLLGKSFQLSFFPGSNVSYPMLRMTHPFFGGRVK